MTTKFNIWGQLCVALPLLFSIGFVVAADTPYDETLDARVEIQRAQMPEPGKAKPVLLVFGANWCPDCAYWIAH